MEAIYFYKRLDSQSDYLFITNNYMYISIRAGNRSNPYNLKITILYFKAFFLNISRTISIRT